ncbi:MAG: 3-hydroxyacyl-CoA dehydrogenase/enoyl-CoA hydratase family protein [Deltaproteobacteria bacterium]|nr:3-hydroxyacyl-CoA dehydrogenase/enoyl-CoA hydratase family protein [Deltaproteobacteria bacterium]
MNPARIKKVAVIGSGVMGKGIAAHLANCGIPSLLLDLERPWVDKALADLPKMKPALLYDAADIRLITPGTIADDLPKVKDCDWIVEVIIEQLQPKRDLYAKLEALLRPNQIVSSNTSGIGWHLLTEGRSAAFKQQFCITHFFNPVRYLKLVELVGGAGTDQRVVQTMATFLTDTLGKGVVWAKDTPNFVANRIGVHGIMVTLHALAKHGWSVEVIDKIMGPPLGRPKSATFRTADLVGLDTLAHVAQTAYEQCTQDEARAIFQLPDFVTRMIQEKFLGDKTKQGFFKKTKNADGATEILAFDPATFAYRAQQKFKAPSLGAAKNIEDVRERVRTVVLAADDAGKIAWPLVSETLVYAANRIPEIADDVVNVDHGMEWGFGWELGPFATWDALGVRVAVERLEKEGRAVPALAAQVLKSGAGSFYQARDARPTYFDAASSAYQSVPAKPGLIVLSQLHVLKKVVEANESGSLLDLGDGVFCCEFHSKMNAIDEGIIAMLNAGVERAEREGQGLVIGNEGVNFCVGANLMLIFLEAQQQNWTQIDEIVRQFQSMGQRIRFAKKPVVVAPFQLALGGGCEVVLSAARVRAAAETYMGLVELGVGLIPAGCGCKNMLLRMQANARASLRATDRIWMSPDDGGPFPKVQRAFETIGFAKVSTSAKEAVNIGYLRATDRVTLDREQLLMDAKADVLELAPGYQPPASETIELPGRGGWMAIRNAIAQFRLQGLVTEYDVVLAEKLAYILTGGNRPGPWTATEQDVLDLEREVFLQLCGDARTHARIQTMLMTGKPLRN